MINKEDAIQTIGQLVYLFGSLCVGYSAVDSPLSSSVAKLGMNRSMEAFNSNINKSVNIFIEGVDLDFYHDIQDLVDRNGDSINKMVSANLDNILEYGKDVNVLTLKKFITI